MIEYHTTRDRSGRVKRIGVNLDGRLVGNVVPSKKINGWQYVPKGQKDGGEVFYNLSDCLKSLEVEQ